MKPDPVVAMVTESGKRIGIPKLLVGVIEEMAAHPRELYGHNRREIYRRALCTLRLDMDMHEHAQTERSRGGRNEPPSTGAEFARSLDPEVMEAIRETWREIMEEKEGAAA